MAWSKWKNKLGNEKAYGWEDINIKFTHTPRPTKKTDFQFLKHHLNRQEKKSVALGFCSSDGKVEIWDNAKPMWSFWRSKISVFPEKYRDK